VPDRGNGLSHVGEIGFNAGHSAASILAALPHAPVTSFDLCAWGYGAPTHALLQRHFGARRLTRVCGDSGLTVRTHAQRLATRMASRSSGSHHDGDHDAPPPLPWLPPFDVFFVDGGHSYAQASLDLAQATRVTHPGGLVIMDY
jgi:hypothetical protein